MTGARSKTKRIRGISGSETAILLLSALFFWHFLKNAEAASEAMRAGLSLCARIVIPSLFPFLVLSDLIFPLLMRGKKKGGMRAVLPELCIGMICGFPIGASLLSSAISRGERGEKDGALLLPFISRPSAAFLFSTVGSEMFSDLGFGILLFFASLMAGGAVFFVGQRGGCLECEFTDLAPRHTMEPRSFPLLLSGAIKRAARVSLEIAAFVTFFAVLSDALRAIAGALSLPALCTVLLTGVLEISGGARAVAQLGGMAGRLLGAFFVGFGGCSAALQVFAVYEEGGNAPPVLRYLLSKTAEGILTAILVAGLEFLR